MTLRLCGKQNAYLTGLLQKSRLPQSAQKSRTLLRLSLRESSSRAPSCDFASQSSSCYSSGDLTTSSQVHLALTRPDRFAPASKGCVAADRQPPRTWGRRTCSRPVRALSGTEASASPTSLIGTRTSGNVAGSAML